jgi:hypothetical protein
MLAVSGASPVWADESAPAQVVVLATLHQLHAQTQGYTFETLSEVVEGLHPDVLAVELTPTDLASRREQSVKQEYQRSIFPLLDRHGYQTVALEPVEPLYTELVSLLRGAERTALERDPDGTRMFELYSEKLFQFLAEYWNSPEAVNSCITDILFESKHLLQAEIFGPKETSAWEGWNQYFRDKIADAARSNPNKRIVVLVGAEHGYWLRAHLKAIGVDVLDTERLLRDLEDQVRRP